MTAYGYVRVSRMDAEHQKYSPAVQEERIRALAAAAGHERVEVLRDLDVSGKEVERRPGYMELVRAVESGEADLVVAWDLSRLHRNRREAERFWDLVVERGTEVRFVDGLTVDVKSATGRMFLALFNAINAWVSEVTSEKIRASLARREEATGERNGNRPYGGLPGEDAGAVLAAFEEARSFDGAARLLNAREVPPRSSGSVWHGSTVRGILQRLDPDRFAAAVPTGTRSGPGTFRLSGLLRCGVCGGVMSGRTDRRSGLVLYDCRRARTTADHGRKWVSEHVILPRVAAEAERAAVLVRRLTLGSAADEARARVLDEKRARILDLAADGLIAKDEARERLDAVEDERRGLATRRNITRIAIPAIVTGDDADEPQRVNEWLRRLLERITVDMATRAQRGPSRQPISLAFAWRDGALAAQEATS
jgi:DNA invertase Pin-like site-specific DNA recombinase